MSLETGSFVTATVTEMSDTRPFVIVGSSSGVNPVEGGWIGKVAEANQDRPTTCRDHACLVEGDDRLPRTFL